MNERRHLSSETIDLLMLASLSSSETEQAKSHLSSCPHCQTRLSELEEDKARFEKFVYPRTLPKVEQKAQRSLMGSLAQRWKLLFPVLGLVGTAAALMVVVNAGSEDEVYVGIKGTNQPAVEVVANRPGSGQFQVKDGARLRPGDRIRFVVDPAGAQHVMIASRDGAGNFTVYYPYGSPTSAEVTPGRQELPGSIELDEVTGREQLVALFSNEPIDAELVKAALSAGDTPSLPGVKALRWEFVKDPQ